MIAAPTIVLAADVGGTHTKVALARFDAGALALIKREAYPSRTYASLELIIETFLREPEVNPYVGGIAAACFAVAGPVEQGRARLTNLVWHVDEAVLGRHFPIPRMSVINDFAAAGLGIDHLGGSDVLTLQEGTAVAHADRMVIGAGTGLGVAWLTWREGGYSVHPSEGGHADFAPVDEIQDELLMHLRREFGRVSYERVLSGPGLPRIFDFLRQRAATAPAHALPDTAPGRDPAGIIAELALAKRDELAVRALDIFASAYGAFAGNMALLALAHGGVYVAGGIAPKIAAKLNDGTFMRAFTAKGRLSSVLETIPVKVVMNEQVGLLGALAEAARISS
ncbi:MAG: glucokinase [Betaproteobacteria bacterium]|nr:glucokinase [Betaproteobacteria bacterium]